MRWKKLLTAPLVFIAVLVILLEDWLWDDLARLAAALARLPVLRQLERLLVALPPYGALLMFGAPSLLLVPVKLAALYFISHGHAAYGFIVAAVAKVVGTALVARIYKLTEPQLLRIGWFARLHERFTVFKKNVYAALKATRIYHAAHARYRQLRAYFRQQRQSFWQRRWAIARKFSRRWKAQNTDVQP